MHSNAQVSYGIKAENNISILLYDNIPNYKNDLGDGIGIGGFLKIDLAKHFAIQPELLFQFLSSTMENDFKYWGMELPVYAVGQLQLVNGNMMYIGIAQYIRLYILQFKINSF